MKLKGLQRMVTWGIFFLQVVSSAFGLHTMAKLPNLYALAGGVFLGLVASVLGHKFLRSRTELFEELKGEGRVRGWLKLGAVLGGILLILLTSKTGFEFVGCPKGWSLVCPIVLVVLFYILSSEEDKGVLQKLEGATAWLIFIFQAASTGWVIFRLFGQPKELEKMIFLFLGGVIVSVGINLLERVYFVQYEEVIRPLVEKVNEEYDWYDLLIEGLIVAAIPAGLVALEVGTTVFAWTMVGYPLGLSILASIGFTPAFEFLLPNGESE